MEARAANKKLEVGPSRDRVSFLSRVCPGYTEDLSKHREGLDVTSGNIVRIELG